MILSIMRKKKSVPGVDYSKGLNSDDLPATQGLVDATRLELSAKITTLELTIKSELNGLRAEMHKMMVSMAQMHAENTKQRNENRIVLDGISILVERQDKVERRMDDLEGMPS